VCGSPAAPAAGSNRRTHPCASNPNSRLPLSGAACSSSFRRDGNLALIECGWRLAAQRDSVIADDVALPGAEKRRKVGDHNALIDQLWSAIEALPDPEPQSDAKGQSKQDALIAMLRRPEGATVDEVVGATGWQRHTVRGVFSGTLKKKLGLTLASAKEERGRVYRIAEPASV
jgi:hypothetical protein